MPCDTIVKPRPALLATFWFGIQLVWGAILAVSLQARSVELAHHNGIEAYAFIAALGAAVGAAVQVVIGPISDRMLARVGSRAILYLAGSLGASLALLWFFFARTFPELVAAFFLLQLTFNVATGPYQAIIPDYVAPQHAGRASAWMAVFTFIGNSTGLLIAGFLENVATVATLLSVAVLLSSLVTFAHVRKLNVRSSLATQLRIDSAFRTLLVSRGFINLGFYTLMGFLFFYVRDSLRVSDVRLHTAVLFLIFTLFGVAGAALAARPADTYDKRLVVSAANIVIVLSFLLLALAQSVSIAGIAAAIAGVAYGAFFTADWSIACALLPASSMGAAMGMWNVATAVPQIIAPVLTAPLVLRLNAVRTGLGPVARCSSLSSNSPLERYCYGVSRRIDCAECKYFVTPACYALRSPLR